MNRAGFLLAACLALPFGIAQAAPRNWIDRYIATHGHCQQQPNGEYTTQNPFEKPIEEWTDEDLVMLKAALDRCDALPEAQTGNSRLWTGQMYDRFASLVHAQQDRTALQDDAKVAAQERAERAEATKARKEAADKQAAAARLEALKRASDQEAQDKKASEERAAATAEEQKAASLLADQTEARAKAAQAEARARHGVEEARQRAARAEAMARDAEQQAALDRQNADRRFADAHADAYAGSSASTGRSATFMLGERTVGCKRRELFLDTAQAIKGQYRPHTEQLVRAGIESGSCSILQPGAYTIAERDAQVACVAHAGSNETCSWIFGYLAKR